MNCRTCKHSYEHNEHGRMARRGFRNCRHLPIWVFVAGHCACRMNPARWEAQS